LRVQKTSQPHWPANRSVTETRSHNQPHAPNEHRNFCDPPAQFRSLDP
jgi:hypothetical protein